VSGESEAHEREMRDRERLIDDGGPAFASSRVCVGNSQHPISTASSYGMSLHDYYVGKALQGLLANPRVKMDRTSLVSLARQYAFDAIEMRRHRAEHRK